MPVNDQVAIYVAVNWLAVFCYVLATVANAGGVLFREESLERRSYLAAWLGLGVHTAAIAYWWRMVGHGPYMAPSEVLSSDAWITMVVFLVFMRFFPRIRPASVVVLPAVFLMIALANFYNPGIR